MFHVIRSEQMAALRPLAFVGPLRSEAPGLVEEMTSEELLGFTRRGVELAWEHGITSRKLILRFLTSLARAREDLSGDEIPDWVRDNIEDDLHTAEERVRRVEGRAESLERQRAPSAGLGS